MDRVSSRLFQRRVSYRGMYEVEQQGHTVDIEVVEVDLSPELEVLEHVHG